MTRTVAPTVPVTVTYELTELGLSLHTGWSADCGRGRRQHGRRPRPPRARTAHAREGGPRSAVSAGAHLVPATGLGGVEAGVGGRQQGGLVATAPGGHPRAHGDARPGVGPDQSKPATVRRTRSASSAAVPSPPPVTTTTNSSPPSRAAKAFPVGHSATQARGCRRQPQHLVPGLVGEGVVDGLEVVEVEEDRAHRRAAVVEVLDQRGQLLVHEQAVAQARQRVAPGLLPYRAASARATSVSNMAWRARAWASRCSESSSRSPRRTPCASRRRRGGPPAPRGPRPARRAAAHGRSGNRLRCSATGPGPDLRGGGRVALGPQHDRQGQQVDGFVVGVLGVHRSAGRDGRPRRGLRRVELTASSWTRATVSSVLALRGIAYCSPSRSSRSSSRRRSRRPRGPARRRRGC